MKPTAGGKKGRVHRSKSSFIWVLGLQGPEQSFGRGESEGEPRRWGARCGGQLQERLSISHLWASDLPSSTPRDRCWLSPLGWRLAVSISVPPHNWRFADPHKHSGPPHNAEEPWGQTGVGCRAVSVPQPR